MGDKQQQKTLSNPQTPNIIIMMKFPVAAAILGLVAQSAQAFRCRDIDVSHADLRTKLQEAIEPSSGLNLNMWATLVDRDGVVCHVAYSGEDRGSQWPGSRVISAQKANTANSFSLDGLALSSGQLYGTVQEGGSLYGLQASNPVNAEAAYGRGSSSAKQYGEDRRDPMVGKRIGGINVFGGGLALYQNCRVVGAIGVSGDTSCTDHSVAWRLRDYLGLDDMTNCPDGRDDVAGVSGVPGMPDDLIFVDSVTAGNFEHPNNCPGFSAGLGPMEPVGV